MSTIPSGISISFVFLTLAGAMFTYFYILHLKSDFLGQLGFLRVSFKLSQQILQEDNKVLISKL